MAGLNGIFSFNNYNNYSNYLNKNSYSNLFSSSSSLGSGINFGDYSMIKNGTYKKLLKAYYALDKSDSTTKSSTSTSSTTTSKDYTLTREAANALKSSANALRDNSLWQKASAQKTEDGTDETSAQDELYSRIKTFVEDYNTILDKAGSSDNVTVLRNATRMVGTTNSMSKLLDEVGITIGADNKLTIDETKLKQAKMTTLNTLFAGSNSYGDRIGQRASNIAAILPTGSSSSASKSTASSSSTAKSIVASTYTNSGNYTDTLSRLLYGQIDTEA